jgi:hypothetical protein
LKRGFRAVLSNMAGWTGLDARALARSSGHGDPRWGAALAATRDLLKYDVAGESLLKRGFRAVLSNMAGWTGLEPATSDVTGRRSNQLNYHPAGGHRSPREGSLVGGTGFEPVTPGV